MVSMAGSEEGKHGEIRASMRKECASQSAALLIVPHQGTSSKPHVTDQKLGKTTYIMLMVYKMTCFVVVVIACFAFLPNSHSAQRFSS